MIKAKYTLPYPYKVGSAFAEPICFLGRAPVKENPILVFKGKYLVSLSTMKE
jgi:hypothetical protein